jgi:hypothetical protein
MMPSQFCALYKAGIGIERWWWQLGGELGERPFQREGCDLLCLRCENTGTPCAEVSRTLAVMINNLQGLGVVMRSCGVLVSSLKKPSSKNPARYFMLGQESVECMFFQSYIMVSKMITYVWRNSL